MLDKRNLRLHEVVNDNKDSKQQNYYQRFFFSRITKDKPFEEQIKFGESSSFDTVYRVIYLGLMKLFILNRLVPNFRIITLGCCMFSLHSVFCQSVDSLKGAELFSQAKKYYRASNLDSAEIVYKKAMISFRESGTWMRYFESYYEMGYVVHKKGNHDLADSIFRSGMLEAEGKFGRQSTFWLELYFGRLEIKEGLNEFDSVLSLADEILEVMDAREEHSEIRLRLLVKKADTYTKLGIYETAISYWLQYVKVVNERFEEDGDRLAKAHEQLGYNHGLNRNYIQSDGYLNRALAYREGQATTSRGLIRLAQLYNSIGGAYLRARRIEEARYAYRKANKIAVEEIGENSPGAIYTFANIGSTFVDYNADSAKWYLEKALVRELRYLPDQNFVIGNSYLNLGMTQKNLGENLAAMSSFRSAISSIKQTTKGFHNYFAKCYNMLGILSVRIGHYDSAGMYFDKAIEANILNNKVIKDSLSYELSDYLQLSNLISSIKGQAELIVERGSKVDSKSLIAMIERVDLGITLIEAFFRNLSSQENIEDNLNDLLHELNLQGSNLAVQMHERTSDEAYLELFLSYAESDRASSLRSLISKENAIRLASIPDSIIGKLYTLDSKVSLAKSRVSNQTLDNTEYWKELLELTQKREAYYEQIEKKFPSYKSLRIRNSEVSIGEIRSWLEPDQIMVEYFTGLTNTYAVVMDDASINLFELSKNEEISALIQLQRDQMRSQNLAEFDEVNYKLYRVLFAEIDEFISAKSLSSSVIIIPDGDINYVSFSSLSTVPSADSYLLDKYIFRYEPSAIVAYNRLKPEATELNLLAVSSDFSSPFEQWTGEDSSLEMVRDTLRALPGVSEELNLISGIIPGDLFRGESATEHQFKENAFGYGAIHIATHAVVDDEIPDRSRLFFSARDDSIEDGALHAYEIYNLKLSAQLVTLSACNTGAGKIKKGEGVMSLSRAFAYAGVPSTVVSLWPASDKSTPELMKRFYQNLKVGQAKDLALSNAKKQYLATAKGKARHPFYWAGFILIGDNSPIEQNRNFLIWGIATFVLMGFTITWYWNQRKTRVG